MNSDAPKVLALPGPEATADTSSGNKLDLSTGTTQTVKLDELGPMVVNSDGTLSRIANWAQMTEPERERTLRVLSARNKLRLANEARKQQGVTADAGAAGRADALSIMDADAPAS